MDAFTVCRGLGTPLTAEQRKYAGAVRYSAEALLDIINDILDVSKLEARKVELEVLDFYLPSLIESAVELMAPRAHGKGIELGAFIDPSARQHVKGDHTRIRQILLNLLSNAIKFTEQGYVGVEVRARSGAPGPHWVRVEAYVFVRSQHESKFNAPSMAGSAVHGLAHPIGDHFVQTKSTLPPHG
jgi:signal transduction histidine kinase